MGTALTEVFGADPDGEVLLGVLREPHAFHDLLHGRVVPMLQLHGSIGTIHAVNAHLFILRCDKHTVLFTLL